jgi:hypothetical protein
MENATFAMLHALARPCPTPRERLLNWEFAEANLERRL